MPLMMPRFGRPGLIGMAARTAVVAGTAAATTGAVRRRQESRAQLDYENQQYEAAQQQAQVQAAAQQAAAQQAVSPSGALKAGDQLLAQLAQLGQLHSSGVLSDEEFSAAKAQLLAQ